MLSQFTVRSDIFVRRRILHVLKTKDMTNSGRSRWSFAHCKPYQIVGMNRPRNHRRRTSLHDHDRTACIRIYPGIPVANC